MSYKVKTHSRGGIIVNNADELFCLYQAGDINLDTPVFDTDINLCLKVSDILPKDSLDPDSESYLAHLDSPEDLKTYSKWHEKRPEFIIISYIFIFLAFCIFILKDAYQKYEGFNLKGTLNSNGIPAVIFIAFVVIALFLINISKSTRFRENSIFIFSLTLLAASTIVAIPKVKDTIAFINQKQDIFVNLKNHYYNLLTHEAPKEYAFTEEVYVENYELLQSLNDAYIDYYTSITALSDATVSVNRVVIDLENTSYNIDEILPLIDDCHKKCYLFIRKLRDTSSALNVDVNDFEKDVDNSFYTACTLNLEYYSIEKTFFETLAELQQLLIENKGNYSVIGTVYMFDTDEKVNKFNALVKKLNEYSRKSVECKTQRKYLSKGLSVDIVWDGEKLKNQFDW